MIPAAVAAAAVVAACGSGAAPKPSAATTQRVPAGRAALFACLKRHGVTPPSFRSRAPGAGPLGQYRRGGPPAVLFAAPGGARRADPKLAAAFQACGGGLRRFGAPGAFRARRSAAIKRFAACVAAHGFKLPAPNLTGGARPVFPAGLQRDRRFVAAARSCASLLVVKPPAGAPPGAIAFGSGGAPPGA